MQNNDEYETKLVIEPNPPPPRNRACINCGLRDLWGAGSRCGYDGHYIGYCGTWDEWCKHWHRDKRKPGEIGVYNEDGRVCNEKGK